MLRIPWRGLLAEDSKPSGFVKIFLKRAVSFSYFYSMKKNPIIVALTAVTGALMITAFGLPSAPEQQTSFSDKYWVLESSSIVPAADLNLDGKPDATLFAIMEECDKDDAEMFKSNGKMMTHHGNNKCNDNEDEVTETGTWTYAPATKQITIHQIDVEQPQIATIKELSSNKMVAVREFTDTNGKKHTITGTYKLK